MVRRMIVMLVLVGLVFGGVYEFQQYKRRAVQQVLASLSAPPQTVSTTVAGYQEWQPRFEAVGNVEAMSGAEMAPEVPGIVDSITFRSGDEVAAGTVLVQLRSDDDQAKLQSLQANSALAKANYDRDVALVRTQATSQANLDAQSANLKSYDAQVVEQQAILDKKTIRAPFAGRLGIRQVDLGDYLNAGTVIVTLQALDPIYVDFMLPQQAIAQLKVGQSVTVTVDTYPGMTFPGEILALDARIDTNNRNIKVRATLKNPDRLLLPGMYATVEITVGSKQRLITLPQTAITYSPSGDTVYIVDDQAKNAQGQAETVVRQTFVKTGLTRGDQVAILSGVAEGQVVVTAGQIKLRNGSPIVVNNAVEPSNDPDPLPVDQ